MNLRHGLCMRRLVLTGLSLSLLLSACGGQKAAPLPEGPVTETGTLVPAQLSRLHRGTDILQINGVDTYYVESTTVSLRDYEGQQVGLHGTLSLNTDPKDLPVLLVDQVNGNAQTGQDIQLPDYQMTLSLPENWMQTQGKDGVALSTTASGSLPVLVITRAETMPPDGVSLLIGGRTAIRSTDASGDEQITVDGPSGFVKITTFPSAASGTTLSEASAILRSIRFAGSQTSSFSSKQTGTGTTTGGAGTPCGGPAGILCPAGSYCAITDATQNIGTCMTIQH